MDATKFSKGNSSYLKAPECNPFNATITDVIESVDFNKKDCLVIQLNNDKKIQLKPKNAEQLIDLFGTDTEGWKGNNVMVNIGITLYNEKEFAVFVFESYSGSKENYQEKYNPPVINDPPQADLKVDPFN